MCTDQYCISPSAMLGLGQWVEQCIHYNIVMAQCVQISTVLVLLLGLGQWVEQCNLTRLGFEVLSKYIFVNY